MSLHHFLLFNRNLGKHEEDSTLEERAESLLFFSPNTTELAERVRVMELMEAFLDVSNLFDQCFDPVHEVIMGDLHYGLLEVEPNIYLCMGVSIVKPLPVLATTSNQDAGMAMRMYRTLVGGDTPTPSPPTSTSPRSQRTASLPAPAKEALRAILRQVYARIEFVCGPLAAAACTVDSPLYKFLQEFIPNCLEDVNCETLLCAPLRCLLGMEHLPIDRTSFLTVQSFIQFASSQPSFFAKHAKLVLFANQLVWSSVENAFPVFAFFQKFFRATTTTKGATFDDGYLPLGKNAFVGEDGDSGSKFYAPHVYFSGTWFRIVALKMKRTVLVFFMDGSRQQHGSGKEEEEQMEADVALQLQRFKQATLGELDKVNSMLEESFKRIVDDQANNAFVYANETNLVLKSSERFQQWTKAALLQDAVFPLAAMRAFHLAWHRIFTPNNNNSEMAIVVCGEWCVTAWRSGKRRLFRFSAARLADASPALLLQKLETDLEKLTSAKFANVVMF